MRLARAPSSRGLVALLLGVACHSSAPEPRRTKPAASASATAAPSAPAPAAAPASAAVPRRRGPGCRVLAVKARSPAPAGTPAVGAAFGGQAWLTLAEGVEVSLKHGETTREFRLAGPGLFLPCPDSEEEVVVASGTVSTTPGPGSRAGAEVTLATPFGVVLYPDAALELAVTRDKLTLRVKQGEATLQDTGDEDLHAPAKVRHVKPADRAVSAGGKVNAGELAKSCDAARTRAVVPPPSERAARGAWAANMLEWHRRVRLRCARAAAATARGTGPEQGRLEEPPEQRKSRAPAGTGAENAPETDGGR
jgi:hypothetical protein